MDKHAGVADGVQLLLLDLQIVHHHAFHADREADDGGADAGAGQELIAQP